jgi:hydrogenase maturation protease
VTALAAEPAAEPGAARHGRILVAGVGNIFLGDDGFGVETVRHLARESLPGHVEAVDVGVRGVHLAYRMLDGYDTCILVDACARGGEPGTLYRIDASAGAPHGSAPHGSVPLDGHRMAPDAVLALLDTLCAGTGARAPRSIVVLGCEPGCLDEGIGLSAPVSAAVPQAVRLILRMIGGDGEQD